MIKTLGERIQISINRKNLKSYIDLPIVIERGERNYIASVPIYNVATQGRTKKEAIKNLKDAVRCYFEGDIGKKLLLQKIKMPRISIYVQKMHVPMQVKS